jgi:hypothetical protein
MDRIRYFPDPDNPIGADRGGRYRITSHKRSLHLPDHQSTCEG